MARRVGSAGTVLRLSAMQISERMGKSAVAIMAYGAAMVPMTNEAIAATMQDKAP